MPKVILNKSTKIKGKGLILAGVEVDVTKAQKEDLEKKGFIGESSKNNTPSNDREIQELVTKVKDLESQLKDGGDENLKTQLAEKDETIESLNTEIENLKTQLAEKTDLTSPKK